MLASGMTQDFFRRHAVRPKDRCGRAYTHTFFTGGSFIVPSHEEEDARLFHAIERDLRANVPIFINEIASPVFRFFLDLDFQVNERLTDADVAAVVKHTNDAMARFFEQVPREGRNPRLLEAIVLDNDSPALCKNALHLQTLLEEVPLFDSNSVVTVDAQGRVAAATPSPSTTVLYDADWAKVPPAGTYQCVVCDGRVKLLAAGDFSFTNIIVPSEALERVRICGPPPPHAIDAFSAKDRIGPWMFTFETVFRLSDASFFVNTKRDPATNRLKQGLHIIFPELCVDIEKALFLREAIIEALTLHVGSSGLAPEGWASVIDNSVYATGKGLRMIGSHKAATCPFCKGVKQDVRCQSCIHGKIDEGRPYVFRSLFIDGTRHLEDENKYRANLSMQIRRCSIRRNMLHPTPGWALYPGCPKFGNMLETSVKDGETTHKITSRNAVFKTDQGGLKRSRARTVPVERKETHEMLQRYIRSRFCKEYRQLRVVKVTQGENSYFIDVAGEGQHFCLNKVPAGDHTSNTIYFQCDREGLCVRCHCPKPVTENRADGPCRKFKSDYVSLDRKDMSMLF